MVEPLQLDLRREEALNEYYAVQAAVRAYDDKSFQIKSWSVTVTVTSIGAAFTSGGGPNLFLAGPELLAFRIVDGLWKSYQIVWLARGATLEQLLSSGDFSAYRGPGIHASFHRHFKSRLVWLRLAPSMLRSNVFLPHMPLALTTMALYWQAYDFAGLRELLSRLPVS